MVERTWEQREQRILEAVLEAHEAGDELDGVQAVADAVGLDVSDARRAVESLEEDGFVAGIESFFMDSGYDLGNIRPTPKTRRLLGQWPSDDAYADVLALLTAQAQAAPEGSQARTWLEGMRDVWESGPKDVATNVIAALIRSQTGLS